MTQDQLHKRIIAYVKKNLETDADIVHDALILHKKNLEIENLIETNLEKQGLSVRQIETMEALYHHPDQSMTPAELADLLRLTRSSMTSNLDGLERQGYIRRENHPQDRRMINVVLTPEGLSKCEEKLPDRYIHMGRIAGCLTSDERQMMIGIYFRLIRELKRLLEEEDARNS